MRLWMVIAPALLATACTTMRQTEPSRTATEEMLISSAADRAAGEIKLNVKGKKVFVDASNYKGLDPGYTVAAVQERLLKNGALLVGDRKTAELVVEMRNGGQSIDQHEFLIGIPSFSLPIPLTANAVTIPEIALYSKAQDIGVSKLAVAAYDSTSGAYEASSGPDYGFAHDNRYTVLLFIGWRNNDFRPDEEGTTANDK